MQTIKILGIKDVHVGAFWQGQKVRNTSHVHRCFPTMELNYSMTVCHNTWTHHVYQNLPSTFTSLLFWMQDFEIRTLL